MKRIVRFSLVGILNTLVDILVLNLLLWLFPSGNTLTLLSYNALACALAAVNSFCCNRIWTFQYREKVTLSLLLRFAGVSGLSLLGNTLVLWLLLQVLPAQLLSVGRGATLLKGLVAALMMLFSFFAQSVLVFVKRKNQHRQMLARLSMGVFPLSLTAVLPAYNEEAVIEQTVRRTVQALSTLVADFEVIVVNDGSKDGTESIVQELARQDGRVRLFSHRVNQGAGAALVSGFHLARKKYTFYMDSDGQFNIYDLRNLLPYLREYDGVFGYRYDRQDPFIRKLNAWLWNRVVSFLFRIRVRDIDCAFKVFRTDYFRHVSLEAKGALLLTEVVYKFARAHYRYTEVPVQHLPREGGKATGAKLSVILKAFKELFFYANKWHIEEQVAESRARAEGIQRFLQQT